MAECTVYDADEKNDHDFDGNEPDLTKVGRGPFGTQDWNDVIMKITVKSGLWRFHEHANGQGRHWDFGPGEYSAPRDFPPKIISGVFVIG